MPACPNPVAMNISTGTAGWCLWTRTAGKWSRSWTEQDSSLIRARAARHSPALRPGFFSPGDREFFKLMELPNVQDWLYYSHSHKGRSHDEDFDDDFRRRHSIGGGDPPNSE